MQANKQASNQERKDEGKDTLPSSLALPAQVSLNVVPINESAVLHELP